jgi:hypothetical protein
MKPDKLVADAVEKAQRILAEYVEPGPRDCEVTINRLMDVLDDGQLIEAVDEVKYGTEERIAGFARGPRAQEMTSAVATTGEKARTR